MTDTLYPTRARTVFRRSTPMLVTGLALTAFVGLPATAVGQGHTGRPPPLRPVHDLAGAVGDFGRDLWEVLPTGYDRTGAARLAGVLATGAVLYALDDEIYARLSEGRPGGVHRNVREVGDFFEPLGLMGNTNAIYAATAATAYLLRRERVQLAAKELLYSHWIAGLTRKTVGRLVGRRRPDEGADASTFESGEGTSFPSGHSSTVFQVAHVLSHHIDRWPASVLLYAAAASVAFQRVDSGAHWASDAWIGAAWGLAVSHAVVGREERGRLGATVTPAPGGGLGLAVRLRR